MRQSGVREEMCRQSLLGALLLLLTASTAITASSSTTSGSLLSRVARAIAASFFPQSHEETDCRLSGQTCEREADCCRRALPVVTPTCANVSTMGGKVCCMRIGSFCSMMPWLLHMPCCEGSICTLDVRQPGIGTRTTCQPPAS